MNKQDLYLDINSKMSEMDLILTSLVNNYYNKSNSQIDKIIDKIKTLISDLWDLKNSNKIYIDCDEVIMQSIIQDLEFINNKLEITTENVLKADLNNAKTTLKNLIAKIKKTNTVIAITKTKQQSESDYSIPNTIINFSEYFKFNSLELETFKNFKSFQHNFISHNNLSVLIGNNGSGKSNLLEAISAIFAELYLNISTKFGYKLEYDIKGHRITLLKEIGKPKKFFCDYRKVTKNKLELNGLIPSKIIAMYSGEETRLWKNYYSKSYEKWKKDVNKINRMRYISKDYWNIALFSLLMSDAEDHKQFIKEDLSINIIDKIEFEFDLIRLKNSIDQNLNRFVNIINPQKKYIINLNFTKLKSLLSYTNSHELFTLLTNASMHKTNKMIKSVKVFFNDGLNISDLSEGEKKKLLLKATMDLVADENSIILLDEPDAHIHEVGKAYICSMFERYSEEYNRQIIVTTHSPTLTHCINNNHLIMLENKDGYSAVINHEKIDKIKNLTGGIWSETQQNIFLSTNNALVLTEGFLDLSYINSAKSIYKDDYTAKFDCLTCNGADNMLNYLKSILELDISNKKIIILFDRDTEGKKNFAKFLKKDPSEIYISDPKVYYKSNIYIMMLPKTENHNSDNFVIEDYFPIEIKKQCLEETYNNITYDFCSIPTNFKSTVKSELKKYINCRDKNCLKGFKVLLDKIESIITEREDCLELEYPLDSI